MEFATRKGRNIKVYQNLPFHVSFNKKINCVTNGVCNKERQEHPKENEMEKSQCGQERANSKEDLFPTTPDERMGIKVTEADATPFTLEELGSAIKTQPGRAPRPDKVPPEVIKENWKVAEAVSGHRNRILLSFGKRTMYINVDEKKQKIHPHSREKIGKRREEEKEKKQLAFQ
ncbi:hypothetical protein QE152_g36008 [Popillia japonica]|uniref:Uncharacterized protein n=1 Tax=Popillia japonica TaxID=7064 RepID=A0AAW1IEA8_POPJA